MSPRIFRLDRTRLFVVWNGVQLSAMSFQGRPVLGALVVPGNSLFHCFQFVPIHGMTNVSVGRPSRRRGIGSLQ